MKHANEEQMSSVAVAFDSMAREKRVDICAECGAPLNKVPLIELVMSYEEDEEQGDIFEQLWHKTCYYQYTKHINQRRRFRDG